MRYLSTCALVAASVLLLPSAPALAQADYGMSPQGQVRTPGRQIRRNEARIANQPATEDEAAGAEVDADVDAQSRGYYAAGPAPEVYDENGVPIPPEQLYVYGDPYPGQAGAGYAVEGDQGSVAYCEQTFKSYDPASGTYLGYDGQRHSCP